MRGLHPRPEAVRTSRLPAAAAVYNELRRRILHGELGAGAALSEVDTAAALEVSRTPVREALRELLGDGLVSESTRRQVTVVVPSAELATEVEHLRRALDEAVCPLAVERLTESDRDGLRLVLIRAARSALAGDLAAALDAEDEFHTALAAAAGPQLLGPAMRRGLGLGRLTSAPGSATPRRVTVAVDLRERLVDALDARDASRAGVLFAEIAAVHLHGITEG